MRRNARRPFVRLKISSRSETVIALPDAWAVAPTEDLLTRLERLFGDRIYIELQRHGRSAERKVEQALNILKFSPKGMAEDVAKVLASAVANAENNHNLDVDALVVAEASVGKSISMKRFATRARGRSSRIVKPFSRIRVVVREQEEA